MTRWTFRQALLVSLVRAAVLTVGLTLLLGTVGWPLVGVALGVATAAVEGLARQRQRGARTVAWAAGWTWTAGALAVGWGLLQGIYVAALAGGASFGQGRARVEHALRGLVDEREWSSGGWQDALHWPGGWGRHTPEGVAAQAAALAALLVALRLRAARPLVALTVLLVVSLAPAFACGCAAKWAVRDPGGHGLWTLWREGSLAPLGVSLALSLALAAWLGDAVVRQPEPERDARMSLRSSRVALALVSPLLLSAAVLAMERAIRVAIEAELVAATSRGDPVRRATALEQLASFARGRARTRLLEVAQRDPDPWVSGTASWILGSVGPLEPEIARAVLAPLRRDPVWQALPTEVELRGLVAFASRAERRGPHGESLPSLLEAEGLDELLEAREARTNGSLVVELLARSLPPTARRRRWAAEGPGAERIRVWLWHPGSREPGHHSLGGYY